MSSAVLRLYRPQPAVDRHFALLAGLSVLLHGSLLILPAARPAAVPPLPPLLATLRLASTPESTPESGAPAVAAAPAALPQKVRQSPAAPAARPSPRLLQAAGPASVPATVSEAALPASAPLPAESAVAAAAAPAVQPAAPAPAAPVAQAAAPAVDPLGAYRRRLGELFAARQDYPRVAAMRGWEGEVRLRLRVARKGNLLAVAVDRSSGFNVLDQHALALLADLGSLPPLPEGVEGSEIQVVVPVTYKLNRAT